MLFKHFLVMATAIAGFTTSTLAVALPPSHPHEMQKPSIILVPGALMFPVLYEPTLKLLRDTGYTARAVDLPSISSNGNDSVHQYTNRTADVRAIQAEIQKEFHDHKNVILVAHSYGGILMSEAIKGYNGRQSEQGPYVTRMVFLSALIEKLGTIDNLKAGIDALTKAEVFCVDEGVNELHWFYGPNSNQSIISTFFNDLSTDLAADVLDETYRTKMAYKPTQELLQWDGYMYSPVTYVKTLKDGALPPAFQQAMIDAVPNGTTKEWTIRELDAGHDSFISQPEALAKILQEAAGEKV